MLLPLFDRVLLRRAPLQKVGSIVVPTQAQRKYAGTRCSVVALGPLVSEKCPDLKIGDEVIIGKYSGTWVNERGDVMDDGDLYICDVEDIIAKVA